MQDQDRARMGVGEREPEHLAQGRLDLLDVISVSIDGELIPLFPVCCITGAALWFSNGKELAWVLMGDVSEGNRREYGALVPKTQLAKLFRVQPLARS